MNKDFASALEELLESECGQYGYKYNWSWCNDEEVCNVIVNGKLLKFDFEQHQLRINTHDDIFEPINELDYTIKYFWIALLNN